MMDLFLTVFSAAFFVTIIRTTTPLLLSTMGGLIADLSGALNVALEGMMLTGCLTAVLVSVFAPWWVAVLAGMGAGAFLGLLMAFFAYRLKADIILVGFAINILAAGGTVFALALATGGDKGTSINLPSKAIPAVDLSFLSSVPVVGPTLTAFLSGHSVLSWVAAALKLPVLATARKNLTSSQSPRIFGTLFMRGELIAMATIDTIGLEPEHLL